MCSRPGDSSLVISIYWMQESHKEARSWQSWILIEDWEIIENKSDGQVQCIFLLYFIVHIRVGRVTTAFFVGRVVGGGGGWTASSRHSVLPWVLICFFFATFWAQSWITIEQQVTFSYVCENILWVQWTRVTFLKHSVNLEHMSCINRHFCILDVAWYNLAINSN